MTRLLTTPRLVLSIVGLIVLNSVLDSKPEGRRLQIRDFLPGDPASSLSLGNHYVTIYVGNPAQPQRLMVSLASEYTSFPCTGCENCGDQHSSPLFDFSTSLVHQCPNNCQFEKSRCEDGSDKCIVVSSQTNDEDTEGGFRGLEVRDTTYLDTTGGRLIPTHRQGFIMDFVCQTAIRGMTQDSLSDGLLSLSMAPSSFISQLHARGKVAARKFALCFSDVHHPQEDGSSIGSIHFGEFDRSRHESTLVWALNVGKSTYGHGNYAVQLKNVYLGIGGGNNPLVSASEGTMSIIPIGKNLASFEPPEEWLKEAVIQSNKAITQLAKNYEEAFKTAFLQLAGVAYDPSGISMSEADLETLPTLFLQIQAHNNVQGGVPFEMPGFTGHLDRDNHYDILLAIPAKHYFMYNHDTGAAITTIQFSEKISYIGAAVLRGHELAFDLDNNRIGFAQVSSCGESLSLNTPPTMSPTMPPNDRMGGRIVNQTGTADGTGHGDGIGFEFPDGEQRVNGTNATDIIVGGGGSGNEQSSGIPAAQGRGNFHVGPGAIQAAERLNELNSYHTVNFDYFHLMGLLALIASFGITVYATRDKSNDKKDVKFKGSKGPVYYNEDYVQKSWNCVYNQPPQPQPPPQPQTCQYPTTRELEISDDANANEEATQGDFSVMSAPQRPQEEAPRRSLGLQIWSNSTKDVFEKKNKGPLYGPGRRDSDFTEGTSTHSDEISYLSEEQSYYSQESDASYFVKKPPLQQQPQEDQLPTVDESSESQYDAATEHGLPPRTPVESATGALDFSISQRTPVGQSFVDITQYSENTSTMDMDRIPPRPSTASAADTVDFSSSQRTPAGQSFIDSMQYSSSTSATGMDGPMKRAANLSSEEHNVTSDDFTPETSSLPGMGATSSLPGMADYYQKPETPMEEPAHEANEEEQPEEEEEEQDYFPGPDEATFVSGESETGYLVAHREADDDQSLLTMEEFADEGSVATRETRGADASGAATQVSEKTDQRSNIGAFRR
jgi:hypothetical protein